jgi:hypothetical protein
MGEVINGRQTATLDDEVVVFIIGMRINRLRRLRSWLPAFRAMPRMLQELGPIRISVCSGSRVSGRDAS